jgi:hypothetical protein
VPESLAAALDMTAELPRYRADRSTTGSQPRVERPADPQSETPQTESQRSAAAAAAAHEAAAAQAAEAQATAAAQIAAAQEAARQRQAGDGQGQYADETMELPIFRELESAWFTTAKAVSEPAQDDLDDLDHDSSPVTTTQRFSTGKPARTGGVPQQAASPESRTGDGYRDLDPATVGAASTNGNGSGPWHTAADEGCPRWCRPGRKFHTAAYPRGGPWSALRVPPRRAARSHQGTVDQPGRKSGRAAVSPGWQGA